MTPPEMLRRAADIMDEAHRTKDREKLSEALALVELVRSGITETLNPGPETIGVALRRPNPFFHLLKRVQNIP